MGNGSEPSTLRGLVISNWEKSGRPGWDLARAIRETESADDALASRGLNPAPTFRERRRDPDFVKNWVRGSRFPFLIPQQTQRGQLPLHRAESERLAEASDKQLALTLTNEQREGARKILQYVADEVERIGDGDPDLAFRLRRYVHARIQLKNRPPARLRARLFDSQEGLCEFCRMPITQLKGTDIHRIGAGRYSEENTVLAHRACHQEHHLREGSQPEEDE